MIWAVHTARRHLLRLHLLAGAGCCEGAIGAAGREGIRVIVPCRYATLMMMMTTWSIAELRSHGFLSSQLLLALNLINNSNTIPVYTDPQILPVVVISINSFALLILLHFAAVVVVVSRCHSRLLQLLHLPCALNPLIHSNIG